MEKGHWGQRREQDKFCSSCPAKRSVLPLSEQDRTKAGQTSHLQFFIKCITHLALFQPISSKSYVSFSITFSTSLFLSNSLRIPTDLPTPYGFHLRNPRISASLFSHSALRKFDKKSKTISVKVSRKSLMEG